MGLLRRSAASALLLLAALASLGLALELGFRGVEALRLWWDAETWAVYDPELGYRLNPGYGDVNAQGLRDHPVPPRSERLRILMLGDSVGFDGDDVDDTWVGHLRRNLHDAPQDGVEVLNAGVPGYTNYQELRYLARDGVRLQPDLVGVGFVLNDLFRYLHQFRVEDGVIVGNRYELTTEALGAAESANRPLWRRSVFLSWLQRRASVIDWHVRDAQGFPFDRRPDLRTAWQDAPWTQVEAQLREMQRLGARHGFGVFVVAFPVGDQYDAALLARDRDYVLKPQRRLAEICARLELPLLDLRPLLDGARDLRGDGLHLSADGRRRVGARVARFLRERGLLASGRG